MDDDGLPSRDFQSALFVLDAQPTLQNNREFVELGRLAGLDPSLGAAHVRHAGRGGFGIDAADVFVDQLGFVACRLNPSGLRDECGHGVGLRAPAFGLRRFNLGPLVLADANLLDHEDRLGWRLRMLLPQTL
jgi:hypothetical protein